MMTRLAHARLLVRNDDEALRSLAETLGLELRIDHAPGPTCRRVAVAARGQAGDEITLGPEVARWGFGPTSRTGTATPTSSPRPRRPRRGRGAYPVARPSCHPKMR